MGLYCLLDCGGGGNGALAAPLALLRAGLAADEPAAAAVAAAALSDVAMVRCAMAGGRASSFTSCIGDIPSTYDSCSPQAGVHHKEGGQALRSLPAPFIRPVPPHLVS